MFHSRKKKLISLLIFRQMEGDLSKKHLKWREDLLKLVAHLEAFIDFEESEDIEHGVPQIIEKGG